jgi:hypothetical protein
MMIMRTARTIVVYIAYVYNRRHEEGPVVVEYTVVLVVPLGC